MAGDARETLLLNMDGKTVGALFAAPYAATGPMHLSPQKLVPRRRSRLRPPARSLPHRKDGRAGFRCALGNG